MDDGSTSSIALFSIHPRYADGILAGTKQVEFRRSRPREAITHVVIYATSPAKRVLGVFSVEEIIKGSPHDLWERFKDVAGIEESAFFSYYEGAENSYAFIVGEVKQLESPLELKDLPGVSTVPQSFMYLPNSVLSLLSWSQN